jgi:nucleoside phosphorylase
MAGPNGGDRRQRLLVALLAAVVCLSPSVVQAGRRGLCATAAAERRGLPHVAIVSAYPAELAPIVAATAIETTVQIDARPYYAGRLAGVRVLLGLTGIGIVNATTAAESLLARPGIVALLMSGTAGTRHHIGDVVLASELVESGRQGIFHANPALLALARRGVTALPEPLERCTPVPPGPADSPFVCLLFAPTVVFGGRAVSGDVFGDMALPCTPGGGEIFGCELPLPAASGAGGEPTPLQAISTQDVEDNESAAVARVAARHQVPFLAVRAGSDGGGDPLGDRGFPTQFFDYYRLAANNAGNVTAAIVAELGRLSGDRAARTTCRLLAAKQWRRAARRIAASP